MDMNTTHLMPELTRSAQFDPGSYDEARNSIDLTWTSGQLVPRYDWTNDRVYDEELVVTTDAVDMSRLKQGASVLDDHKGRGLENVLGSVSEAWLSAGVGYARAILSKDEAKAGRVADIKAGVIRHISTGYSIQLIEMVPPSLRNDGGKNWLYRALRWTPYELSFVPIPAEVGIGTRSKPAEGGSPCAFITRAAAQQPQEETMPQANVPGGTQNQAAATEEIRSAAPAQTQQPAAPAAPAAAVVDQSADLIARSAQISELCHRHGLGNLAPELIRSGADVSKAQATVLEALARDDAAAGGHRNASPRIETVRDQMQVRLAGVEQAIMHRLAANVKLDDNGKQYRGMSLIELGRDFLEAHNVNTRGMDRMTLAGEMLTHRSATAGMQGTSDFANLFANVASKRMRNAYEENPGTYAMWARRAPNAPDFKSMSVVQMSGAPDLMQVNEQGEYTYGTVKDGGTSYGVVTYGRIVALTRQAIINDDLRAFDRLATAFGFAARRLENRLVYAQLTGADYSTDNGNLQTGGGSVLSLTTLGNARTAMRKMKGLQAEELNLAPSYLIVPAALEQLAYQLTSSNYVAAKPSDTNEFRAGGRSAVEPIVEPVLDASSATAWYAAASSAAVDTVEYCYLDGAEGPVIESKNGWEVDGVEYKCRLDFAAKAVDYRGLHKGAGA